MRDTSSTPCFSFFSLLSRLDTKVYELYIRAFLGTAERFCEAVVLESRNAPTLQGLILSPEQDPFVKRINVLFVDYLVQQVVVACADAGYIIHAMRDGVIPLIAPLKVRSPLFYPLKLTNPAE